MNWTTSDNFSLLKADVEVSLCGDKGHRTRLTDITIPERTLRRTVSTFSGILIPIIVNRVHYFSQKIEDRDFMKYIIIERENKNYGMRRPEVISTIGQMAQFIYRGACADHWKYLNKRTNEGYQR